MKSTHLSPFIPPMLDGVSASKLHLPKLDNNPSSVFDYLTTQFAHISAQEWQQRFVDGLVYDNQGNRLNVDAPYLAHQDIFYYRFLAHEVTVPFQHQILFENEHLLVVDKPHFLSTIPRGSFIRQTLLVRLRVELDIPTLAPAHRLDRVTAGLVLFTKRRELRGAYQLLFQNRQVGKTYFAVAPVLPDLIGRPEPTVVKTRIIKQHGVAQASQVPGEPNSHSEVELVDHRGDLGLYRLRPSTGKTHQLRLHMFHLGAPILQDNFYPEFIGRELTDYRFPLQLLSATLEFTDPLSGQERIFRSNRQLELWPDEIKY